MNSIDPPATVRTALVTGSSGLIGRAVAARLAADGWTVVGVDRTVPDDAPGRVVVADLTTQDGLARAVELVRATAGLRLVVNNAGATGPRRRPENITIADWDAAQASNVRPVIALSIAAARRWISTGRPGSIVNLSSPGAARAHLHRAVYDATKGAVESFTRALAVDLGEHGIRVNAVVPAQVEPAADIPDGGRPDLPLGRGATPAQVAAAVAFLASDDAGATTGHALAVDGGLLAQARSANVAVRARPGAAE